jgi:hypothetical protein
MVSMVSIVSSIGSLPQVLVALRVVEADSEMLSA